MKNKNIINRQKLKQALSNFKQANILVIGDIIIDHFIYGSVSRISPEAPVPVVNVNREDLLLGGSANVLHNLHALGAQGTISGIIGQDFIGDTLLQLLADIDSPSTGVVRCHDRPSTKKTRVIAQNQQVVRFDREQTGPLNAESINQIKKFLTANIDDYQAVVLSDYNKGVICQEIVNHLYNLLGDRPQIPIIVDPKPGHPEFFRGASIITPNNHEAEQMSGIKITDDKSLLKAAKTLKDLVKAQAVLITRGEQGMALLVDDKPLFTIPTVAREVYDVTGAGDTVIATIASSLAVGLSYEEAAVLANYAAGLVVGKVGTATTNIKEIRSLFK